MGGVASGTLEPGSGVRAQASPSGQGREAEADGRKPAAGRAYRF